MSRIPRVALSRIAGVLAIAGSGLIVATASAQSDRAAVTVAGTPPATVTTSAVRHWTDVARASARGGRPTVRALHEQVLTLLVTFAWIEGEARELGLTVTDAEIQASFEQQRRVSFPKEADYRRFLAESGQTQADVLQRVREDLLSEAIQKRVFAAAHAGVTDAQVDARVAKEGPQENPERRDIRLVLTGRRTDALKARRELEHGATWEAVARRYSIASHGVIRGLVRGGQPGAFDNALFRARPHRLTGPVKSRFGFAVFEVVRVQRATPVPVAEQRARARKALEASAERAAASSFLKAFTAKWTARTACAPEYAWAKECANRG